MGGRYHHYNKGELFQEETKNQYIYQSNEGGARLELIHQ
ncbi:hypothetical protein BACCIP111895_01394 [Neobacillus rhizosphaerae]|uniref:Uncharacterized protein n=1 Tax=Neobacillus rhizosphaerae TaxID=2880965 RepID=A0ABM9ENN8_9BACI|nr:hypothetical protein BACCIP111895_01394 [Neobacillus rhizosphaerae]